MPMTTGQFNSYLNEASKKVQIAQSLLDKKSYARKFVNFQTTKKQVQYVQDIENMGAAEIWPEGAARPEKTMNEGWRQSYTQTPWAALIDITKPMRKFGLTDLINKLLAQLKFAPVKTREIIFANYLEFGDLSTGLPQAGLHNMINTLGGDGLTLFHAAHTNKTGGGTWRNLSAASDDLTETGLGTIRTYLTRGKDNTGYATGVRLQNVIIPADLETKAVKLFNSALEPTTNNNAVNVGKRFAPGGYWVHPLLVDTTAWFGQTDASEGTLDAFIGWNDEVESGPNNRNPRTGNECVSVDFSIAHGALALHSLLKVT